MRFVPLHIYWKLLIIVNSNVLCSTAVAFCAPDVSNESCLRSHREQSRCNTIQNAVWHHGVFHLHPNGFYTCCWRDWRKAQQSLLRSRCSLRTVWVHQTRIKRTQETILGSFYFIEEIELAKGGENFNKRF